MAEYQESRRRKILMACERCWPLTGPHALPNYADCSGFVASVAREVGIALSGSANQIHGRIQLPPWYVIGAGDAAATTAAIMATNGYFVVAAWKSTAGGSGHVSVIVDSNQSHRTRAFHGRARAYWGTLNAVGQRYGMHSDSFGSVKRPSVVYASREISVM